MIRFFPSLRNQLVAFFVLLCLSSYVLAGCPATPASVLSIWNPANLQQMAYALGLLMIVIQGLRYIIADSAQERAEVKKGLMYIVIGLLVVYGYQNLTGLYCDVAGIT